MAERAAILLRTVHLAPGTTTLSSRRKKRSNRVVHGPVERTLSLSVGPKRFSSRGVLLVAVKPEGLAARRERLS